MANTTHMNTHKLLLSVDNESNADCFSPRQLHSKID